MIPSGDEDRGFVDSVQSFAELIVELMIVAVLLYAFYQILTILWPLL